MKILGLISSPADPASRVRIMQYQPWLKKESADLYCKYFLPFRDADPAGWSRSLKKITGISEWRSSDLVKSAGRIPLLFSQSGYDLIWQNRLIQLKHSFWEKRLKKPVIFDFDDAIWLNEGADHVKEKIGRCQMTFAGNAFLAGFAKQYNPNTVIVPSTVDTANLFPLPAADGKFTIGWIGTRSNFLYLDLIKKPLLDFLSANKEVRLNIISSVWPGSFPPPGGQLVFRKWETRKENEYINELSVGLMPLTDTDWAKGKCSYKLLQYLACGKPVIASPVGVNATILSQSDTGIAATREEDWYPALEKMMNDAEHSRARGINGRKLVVEGYSAEGWSPTILEHMKTVL